jgi:hypothetical protein
MDRILQSFPKFTFLWHPFGFKTNLTHPQTNKFNILKVTIVRHSYVNLKLNKSPFGNLQARSIKSYFLFEVNYLVTFSVFETPVYFFLLFGFYFLTTGNSQVRGSQVWSHKCFNAQCWAPFGFLSENDKFCLCFLCIILTWFHNHSSPRLHFCRIKSSTPQAYMATSFMAIRSYLVSIKFTWSLID